MGRNQPPAPGDSRRQPRLPCAGSVLAFDYGGRRLGVAVGDLALKISHPLETVDTADSVARFDRIAALIAEWRPVLCVVGWPVCDDGTAHELAPSVRAFCEQIQRRFGLPVACVDERFTSAEAGQRLGAVGVRGRAQKAYLDQVAATTILDDYFAQHDDQDA